MTEHTVKSTEEKASMFIVSTCQLLPKSFSSVSDCMHDLTMSQMTAPKEYSVSCGSTEEFFILPLNTCIGDKDALLCSTDQLAFTGDFPVLPSDMTGLSDRIMFVKIEPYHKYPGFVRLREFGEMNYNWKCKKYEFNYTAERGEYLSLDLASCAAMYFINFKQASRWNEVSLPGTVCGPAIKSDIDSNENLGSDTVKSLFCPEWPTEAKTWPIRTRNYRWPTTATISKVVQNGCHVVYSQHRSCRDDKEQWRLSFSVAEVILLQSWTQIQQIVYHLLRFFAKRELIQKDCPKEDEVLFQYHLKTLMLWTCEKTPPEWWNSFSIIAMCCVLLKTLSDWLKRRHFPNYFIPEANLFHEPLSSAILHQTKRRLNEFHNSGNLSIWFVENYILPITQTHIVDQKTGKALPDFMDCLLPLLEFRKAFELKTLDLMFSLRISNSNKIGRRTIKDGFYSGLRKVSKEPMYNQKHTTAMTYFPAIEKILCFRYYAIVLYSLHAAHGLCYGEISWESSLFVELVEGMLIHPKIMSQHHNFPKTYTEQSSRFQYLRAMGFMGHLTGSNSPSEFQLVSLMSKEFLIKTLECDDSKSNGIAPAALAYLAALHFATSKYETAIRFCSAVLVDKTPQNEKETLNAGCLLFIDDVARIVGLCVLHRVITDSNPRYISGRLYLDLRLSSKVFAHYLTALSAERKPTSLDLCHDLPVSSFPMDEYLKALRKKKYIVLVKSCTHFNATRQIVYRRTDSLTETDTSSLNPMITKEAVIDSLMEYVLENMKSFYSVICNDFGIQCNTVDCYRALYLYKCHQYNKVLRLCKRILCEPEIKNDLMVFSFTKVLLLPPFDSFFDRDIQSLLGLHTLCYYLSPLNYDIRKFGKTVNSAYVDVFTNDMYFNWCRESVMNCDSIRCQNILGRHFLAKYLKVRCCIDSNLPYSEALTEFASRETANRPFENIIRRFLLRKLIIIKK